MKRTIVLTILLIIILHLFASPKIGLVLSGGGAKGMAHLGMLKVIEESGIPIDYIVGTSMGSIIGGLYAIGYSTDEIEAFIFNIDWNSLFQNEVDRKDYYVSEKRWKQTASHYFSINEDFKLSLPQGFITGNNLHLELINLTWNSAHIHDFDKLEIPFRCIATDLSTGKMIVLNNMPLADAMRASSSVPSIFMPFEKDGELIVDGGISQNLPVETAKSLGADFIISLKANTALSEGENLSNIFSVLNQTINIGISKSMEESLEMSDIVINPQVGSFSVSDFNNIKDLIEAGRIEALQYKTRLDSLAKLFHTERDTKDSTFKKSCLPDSIEFNHISVKNNYNIHASKIKEYVNIIPNQKYHKSQVIASFHRAWASNLFDQIYPQIEENNDGFELIIFVKEKEGKRLGANMTYNYYNGLIAGGVLEFNNVLQNNSKLLINAQMGGRYALDIDYVKNFGKHYGVYYRVFPYVKEDKILMFNQNHSKTMSLKYLEYGANLGVGAFSYFNNILEPFIYHYRINIYKDITETEVEKQSVYSSGYGIKFYHENINDMLFPTAGKKLFAKLNVADKSAINQYTYKKMMVRSNTYVPLSKSISLCAQGEYGTYFKSSPVEVDPFYIGGIDSFLGAQPQEIKTPFYRNANIFLRLNKNDKYFVDLAYNYLTWGEYDKWFDMDHTKKAYGLIFGYKNIITPIRLAVSIDEDKYKLFFLSVGFDYDAFEFSRR